MSKNELISAINTSKPAKNNKKNIFKSKSLMKPSKKKVLRSIIKEIKEIFHDPIIDLDEKIEEIKKILYDPRNNLFKQEEDHYKPVRVGNAFSSNYIEYINNRDKGEILSPKDYLNVIRPYLSHMRNDPKTKGEWKIKLTIAIIVSSSKDSEEPRIMYSPSDNIEIMIGNEADEVIEDLFDFFLQRYQKGLEESEGE